MLSADAQAGAHNAFSNESEAMVGKVPEIEFDFKPLGGH